jgi:cytochrome b pre-mRNA-processing protein 3
MLSWLKSKADERHKARKLYGAVVARARAPEHFTVGGVADTPEGRCALIALHVAMVSDRLLREGEAGRQLAQRLNEVFVTDFDDAMREMGVGDLGVPRRVKKAAAGLYDQFQSYRAAVREGGPDAVVRLMQDLLERSGGDVTRAGGLARLVEDMAAALARAQAGDLLAGELSLPGAAGEARGGRA